MLHLGQKLDFSKHTKAQKEISVIKKTSECIAKKFASNNI